MLKFEITVYGKGRGKRLILGFKVEVNTMVYFKFYLQNLLLRFTLKL
jgi:hypothetical protein